MQTVSELFTRLGRNRIRQELGHGQQVLTRAVAENVMPAHWYFGVRRLCEDQGVEVPEHLFRSQRRSGTAA